MARLVLQIENLETGTSEERTFTESPVRLGRHPRNEVSLDFGFVSQWHGVFRFDEEGCSYLDQGSTNGSFINGRRLGVAEERPVDSQDELRIGVVRLRCRVDQGTGVESRASGVSMSPRVAAPPMLDAPPAPPSVRQEPSSRVHRPEPKSPRTFSKTPVAPFAPPAQRGVSVTQAESRFRTRIKELLAPELVPATEPEWDELLVRLVDSAERLSGIVVADHHDDEQLSRALMDGGPEDAPAAQRLLSFLLDIRAPMSGPERLLQSLLQAESTRD